LECGADKRSYSLSASDASSKVRSKVEDLRRVTLDIFLIYFKLGVGPACNHKLKVIVRLNCGESTPWPDLGFETPVHRDSTPIAVVGGKQSKFFRSDGASNQRVSAICPQNNLSKLCYRIAAFPMTSYAGDSAFFNLDFIDLESFANFCSRLRSSVDEQLIQYGFPWTISYRRLRNNR